MDVFIVTMLIFIGLCLGSFMGAQVWRLRARQLEEEKQAGGPYDKREYKQLKPLIAETVSHDRSRCLHCGHQLASKDLIPLVSWLSTGGRCRYCKRQIGQFEPLMEVGMAVFFVVSYLVWPQPLDTISLNLLGFIFWLILGVMLIGLLAYDFKWFLLPDQLMFPAMLTAAVIAELHIIQSTSATSAIVSLNAAIAILSGLYLVIYVVGEKLKRQWIGFGDVKLGLVLALALANWPLALLTLFLANLIGLLLILPLMATKKVARTTRLPFGPLLITGFFLAALFGQGVVDWYLHVAMLG